MDEFKRLESLNDSRWNNLLKCNAFKKLTELEEFEKHARDRSIAATLQEEKQNLRYLKKFKDKYDPLMKEANFNFVHKIVKVTKNEKLCRRYSHLHPNEIQLSIRRSIYRISNEANKMAREIHNKENEIRKLIMDHPKEVKTLNKSTKSNRIMANISEIDRKIMLVSFLSRKTKMVVESEKRNLLQFDVISEQLLNDIISTSASLVREVEITDSIRADIKNTDRKYKIENRGDEKFAKEANYNINKLNYMTNSLEQFRDLLTKSKEMTKMEKEFLASLPWTLDKHDSYDSVSTRSSDSKPKLDEEKNSLYSNLLKYGIDHFIDKNKISKTLNDLKNNAASSSIEYKIPENIAEYIISMNNTSNTIDELALNYVLKKTNFTTVDDFLKKIENTKNDLIKLNELNAVRLSLWKILINKDVYTIEHVLKLNLITNEDIEYSKQVDDLNAFLDEQKPKLSAKEKTKPHYIKLLNDLYFTMQTIQKIFDQIYFKDNSAEQNPNIKFTESMETTDKNLIKFVEELKSMVHAAVQKMRRCVLKSEHIDYSSEQLRVACALYVYQNQNRIQGNILKQKIKQDNILKNDLEDDNPKISSETVLTRVDIKRQADQLIKNVKEKDLDVSKNKRKPISFRKSFIHL